MTRYMAISYVVEGARIQCSQGIGQSTLRSTADNMVRLHEQTLLTVADSKPYSNVQPFLQCSSKLNPAVIAADGSPAVCNPAICMKWTNGDSNLTLGGETVLNSSGTLVCMYHGRIQIIDDGQRKG